MRKIRLWLKLAMTSTIMLAALFLAACGGRSNNDVGNIYDYYNNDEQQAILPFPIPEDGDGAAQQERPDFYGVVGMPADWTAPFTPPEPMELDIDRGAVMAVAANRSFAINAHGELFAWGMNSQGRLGDGTTENRHSPVMVMGDVASVAVGNYLSNAITNDGNLYAWGAGAFNLTIGDGEIAVPRHSPRRIAGDIAKVYTNGPTAVAITTDGDLYAWGQGMWSLFHFNFTDPTNHGHEWTRPQIVIHGIQRVSFNGHGVMLVNHANELHGWSSRMQEDSGFIQEYFPGWVFGWTGMESAHPLRNFAEILPTMENVADISLGDEHALLLTTDGRLYAWGRNHRGQLGNGTTTNSPSELVFVMGNVIHISAGAEHSMAITANGTLYAWGRNQFGRLGDGTTTDRSSPVAVMQNVNNVVAGSNHSMAITNDGRLWAWGDNRQGQLGDGTTTTQHSPVLIMENMMLLAR